MFAMFDLEKTEKRTKLLGKENASLIDLYVKDKDEGLEKIEDAKIKEAAKASWAKEKKEAQKVSEAVQSMCEVITPLLAICDMGRMIEAQPNDSAETKSKIKDLNRYGEKILAIVVGTGHSDFPPELLLLLKLITSLK